jgi:DNA-binding response OmpR family regulator
MTILLLHDDPWDRERIASVLRTAGYAVIATDDIDYIIAIIEDAHEFVSLLIAPPHEYHSDLKDRMRANRGDIYTVVIDECTELATRLTLPILVNTCLDLAKPQAPDYVAITRDIAQALS